MQLLNSTCTANSHQLGKKNFISINKVVCWTPTAEYIAGKNFFEIKSKF